jgi:murein L,D-transpeptidase YcbB/YkuD
MHGLAREIGMRRSVGQRVWAAGFAAALAGAGGALAQAPAGVSPAFSPGSHDRMARALQVHREIAQRGGWPAVPQAAFGAKPGSRGPQIEALRARLVASGDLPAALAAGDAFDAALELGLKRFQARHGLSLTGSVGALTLKALNMPIRERIEALEASLARLAGNGFVFARRYVVVNIPAATVEAIEDDRVARRYTAVVGRKDRQSPVLETRITAVNLNPTWTVPVSIVKKDILPKLRSDPNYLASSHMRLLAGGQEIDPRSVDLSGRGAVNFTIRQDPGPWNALGAVRIDMPNRHAVFLHDTPKKELFRSDVRFHSSGCARVQNVRELAVWLLEGSEWTRERIDSVIESEDRRDIRLARPVPVAWVYLTAWADADGTVQFRDDIYDLDNERGIASTTIVARAPAPPGTAVTRSLTSAAPAPPAAPAPGAWSADLR